MRKKTCAICRQTFQPERQFQKTCSIAHAIDYARLQEQRKQDKARKKQRSADRKRKREMRPLRWFHARAQRVFNQFIRLRDKDEPCISCKKPPGVVDIFTGGGWDCGHYRSIGAASHLRYTEDNAHKQCKKCNNQKSGNAVDYRLNLIDRIGLARVEALENNNEPRKWTRNELEEIYQNYRQKVKKLESEST